MKRTLSVFLAALLLISFSTIFAQDYKIPMDHPDYEKIETNLLEGLKSDNTGLQFSSAFALGEMKSEMAINPLIKMLREHKDENFRILAALSLAKIGTERSKYMVRRIGEFVENAKVSKFCEKFLKVEKKELPESDQKLVTKLLER